MLTLVIGNYNYSSWSLRPWALLTHLGLPFEVVRLTLDTPQFAAEVAQHSPAGRVPVLRDGALTIWESLAILEYASELAGGRGWPAERGARAHARAVAAEMHAGFAALRAECPMNIRARGRRVPMTAARAAAVARIDALWSDCRRRYAGGGPWLFGGYSAADAMFLPVAFRFQTYGSDGLGAEARAYLATALADPTIEPWVRRAEAETEVIAYSEVGQAP
ncbi:MAG: glutathione S-transferase family protein [Proteobacteria bacterium]|nr:glutathione S-transferase family protein [Pseudomonadota bacterium]